MKETINLVISGTALAVSIIWPLVAWYLFNEKERELSYSPVLVVHQSSGMRPAFEAGSVILHTYSVRLYNKGRLPASNAQILFKAEDGITFPSDLKVTLDPPSPHDVRLSEQEVEVKLNRAISSTDEIRISLSEIPVPDPWRERVVKPWVYSEQGMAPIQSSSSSVVAPAPPARDSR